MGECIFCKISEHALPASIIAETDNVIAFDDINPKAPIHVLIIPKKHIKSIAELSPNDGYLLVEMTEIANNLAVKKGLENGYRLVFNVGSDSGAEVPHLHLHLIGGRKLNSMA